MKKHKRKDYKHVCIAKKHKDPSYQQEELSKQQQYTKQSRKEHMYKRQNAHEINSSRRDICSTEHNITNIQQEECRDINTLEHLPQKGKTPLTLKQSNITTKKRKNQTSHTSKKPNVKEAENTRTHTQILQRIKWGLQSCIMWRISYKILHVWPINLCHTMNQTIQIPVGLQVP